MIMGKDFEITSPALEELAIPESKLHHTPSVQLCFFSEFRHLKKSVVELKTEKDRLCKECVFYRLFPGSGRKDKK